MNNLKKIFYHQFTIFFVSILFLLCNDDQKSHHNKIFDTILKDKDSYFYVDIENYPENKGTSPIGIFDSGTGGLAVLDVIINLDQYNNVTHDYISEGDGNKDFSRECFVYLGDQANMPYGNYARENKTDLLKEHIIKDLQFLLGNKYYLDRQDSIYREDKEPVKVIVIACNTATAYGKKDIENFIQKANLNMKVVGVIDAGVRAALQTLDKDEDGTFAIMATAGTVKSGGYVKALHAELERQKYTGKISIFQQAGIGLAGAIDGAPEFIKPNAKWPQATYRGPSENHNEVKIDISILPRYDFSWEENQMLYEGELSNPQNLQINSVENYISYHLVSLLEKIKKNPESDKLKAIILGCTHYPFYQQVFKQKLERLYHYQENGEFIYQPLLEDEIAWIDPSQNTAIELYEHLKLSDQVNHQDLPRSEFYISIPNDANPDIRTDSSRNFTYEYKYGRNVGEIQEYVKRVPFNSTNLSPEISSRLSSDVPSTFQLIQHFNRHNDKLNKLAAEEKF
jgi:glutamate racemase